jgi:O-succinylbenzoic acid--CoA ligase
LTTLSVLDAALEYPRRLALIDGERSVDFAELAERVRERVRSLSQAVGGSSVRVLRTNLVALATDGGVATVEWVFALIELGLGFLPLHARLTLSERERLLGMLPIAALVDPAGGVELREPASGLAEARQLIGRDPLLAAIATSGTSGVPRVALLSRRAFLASAAASAAHLGWRADDRWLSCLPVAHIGGLSVFTRCLLARRPVVLTPRRPEQSSAAALAEAVIRGEATLLSVVPTQLRGLLDLGSAFTLPRRVRVLLTGGAAASAALLGDCADRGWPVLTSYGSTEACSQIATQAPGTVNRGERGSGRPLPGVSVRLEKGLIEVAGPTLFSGYLGESVDPGVRSDGWFQTRDLGRFDEHGQLHVLGRVDDVIISGGENVAPWEVEAVLETCPGVREACVFGVPDPRWGQLVAAALNVKDPDPEAVLVRAAAIACERLAAFKRPRLYAWTSAFAEGRTGKLDRLQTAHELSPRLRPLTHARDD